MPYPSPSDDDPLLGWLIGSLTRLQVRYPSVVRHLGKGDDSINISFFLEDLAMACAESLQAGNIAAFHSMDLPHDVRIQIPTQIDERLTRKIVAAVNDFLQIYASPHK